MKFGEVKTKQALGLTLAHATQGVNGKIAKGTILSNQNIDDLSALDVDAVIVATLEKDDLSENEAASKIAQAIKASGITCGKQVSGRTNLFSKHTGIVQLNTEEVNKFNSIDPAITIATLANFEHVNEKRLIATIKIIPFAVKQKLVNKAQEFTNLIDVLAYAPLKCQLIQTKTNSIKDKVLDKTRIVTEQRLAKYGASLLEEQRCAHTSEKIKLELEKALTNKADLILVSLASAVCDEDDVLPFAIKQCQGKVERVGMPVDPGNLLVLGSINDIPVIGLPGCARSKKENGFDWVLQRICAKLKVTSSDIKAMGVGGLLDEIHQRTQSRVIPEASSSKDIAAVLLAAGSSTRMGEKNKLLESWHGKALITYAIEALAKAKKQKIIAKLIVVSGHEHEKLNSQLKEYDLVITHNEYYKSGMASSIATGINSLADNCRGAFICLGDMPLLSAKLIEKMIDCFDSSANKDIVVPVCGGKRGHPVLFGSRHFPSLVNLKGDTGARQILAENKDAVVEFEADEKVLLDFDNQQAFSDTTE